jgi:ABC-2 type transport system ATP-binding protein
MIEGGRIVFSDTMDAFNNYVAPHSVLAFMEAPPAVEELLKIEGVVNADFLTERQVRLYFSGERTVAEKIIAASIQGGWRLQEINLEKSSLDEIFAELSNKNVPKIRF